MRAGDIDGPPRENAVGLGPSVTLAATRIVRRQMHVKRLRTSSRTSSIKGGSISISQDSGSEVAHRMTRSCPGSGQSRRCGRQHRDGCRTVASLNAIWSDGKRRQAPDDYRPGECHHPGGARRAASRVAGGLGAEDPDPPWQRATRTPVAVSWRLARSEGIASGPPAIVSATPRTYPRPGPRPWFRRTPADLHVTSTVSRSISEPKSACYGRSWVQPMCAGCHGPVDHITPEVRQMLADRYPKDRATGFTLGEIRGWYWVEMPKPH